MPDSISERECNPQGAYTISRQTPHDHEIIPILDTSIATYFSHLKLLFYLCGLLHLTPYTLPTL